MPQEGFKLCSDTVQPNVRTLLSGKRTQLEKNWPKIAYFYRFLEHLIHFPIQYLFKILNEGKP